MQKEWVDLIAAVAWPLVGLIAILILGPGGLLKGIIKELSSVATSIEDLKSQVSQLKEAEAKISQSTDKVSDLRTQLGEMEKQLDSIKLLTGDLVTQSLSGDQRDSFDDGSSIHSSKTASNLTAQQLYELIVERWNELCAALRSILGDDNFDGRSIGEAARQLVDKRRINQINSQQAEQIEALSAKMKRFRRLRGSADDWLDAEVYENFANGVTEALVALQAKRKVRQADGD